MTPPLEHALTVSGSREPLSTELTLPMQQSVRGTVLAVLGWKANSPEEAALHLQQAFEVPTMTGDAVVRVPVNVLGQNIGHVDLRGDQEPTFYSGLKNTRAVASVALRTRGETPPGANGHV